MWIVIDERTGKVLHETRHFDFINDSPTKLVIICFDTKDDALSFAKKVGCTQGIAVKILSKSQQSIAQKFNVINFNNLKTRNEN